MKDQTFLHFAINANSASGEVVGRRSAAVQSGHRLNRLIWGEDLMNVRRSLLIGAVGATALGLVPASVAAASTHSASTTTLRFTATTTAMKSSKTAFVETGTDTQGKTLIGWFTLSCQVTSSTAAHCGGAGSALNGMIYFTFPLSTTSKTFSGKVTGGTGAYSGATGTIKGKSISSTKEAVIIVIR
jgi:hypothetical protein